MMKLRIPFLALILSLFIGICGCTQKELPEVSLPSLPVSSSSFQIQFIDVGQGDAALVECDGAYMLIDGVGKSAGETVYDVLEDKGVQHLQILAISHPHQDHIGGLAKALTYASKIDL